jgi:flagellar protein FlbD
MICLKRLNGTEFWLNAELIEQIDSAPDTVITLTTGNNIIVLEKASAVIEKIIAYQQQTKQNKESNYSIHQSSSPKFSIGDPDRRRVDSR